MANLINEIDAKTMERISAKMQEIILQYSKLDETKCNFGSYHMLLVGMGARYKELATILKSHSSMDNVVDNIAAILVQIRNNFVKQWSLIINYFPLDSKIRRSYPLAVAIDEIKKNKPKFNNDEKYAYYIHEVQILINLYDKMLSFLTKINPTLSIKHTNCNSFNNSDIIFNYVQTLSLNGHFTF